MSQRKSTTKLPDPVPYSGHHIWVARVVLVALILSLLISLGSSSDAGVGFLPNIYTIEVVNEYPHDLDAFTQGLLYAGNGTLYESTGLSGRSSVMRVALQTGKVEAQYNMDGSLFGEGLTLLDERLYQVTRLKKFGFIYDAGNPSILSEFTHQMNGGWGLATDGKIVLGSDGSSTLYRMGPQTMEVCAVIQKHAIRYGDAEVSNLNELEYVNGEVWANVWQTDCIARISPENGTLTGWIILSDLRKRLMEAGEKGFSDLNGIAWDAGRHRIFVTGKLWPKLYEIKVHMRTDQSHDNIGQICIPWWAYLFASPTETQILSNPK